MKKNAIIKGEVWLNLVLIIMVLNVILIYLIKPLLFILIYISLLILFCRLNINFFDFRKKKFILFIMPLVILNINFYFNNKISYQFDNSKYCKKEILLKLNRVEKSNSSLTDKYFVEEVSPGLNKMKGSVVTLEDNFGINKFKNNEILVTGLLNDDIKQKSISISSIKHNNQGESLLKRYIKFIILSDKVMTNAECFGFSLLTGDKTNLKTNLKTKMANTGTAHLLAVSGLHIGLFYFIIFKLVSLFLKNIKLCKCFSLLVCLVYVASIHFQESATRALIMIAVFECSRLLFVKFSMLNSLSFTAIILIILDPYIIYNLSFQLSFTVVLFIIYLVKENPFINSGKDKFYSKYFCYLFISLAASTGCSLLLIDKFNHFSFSSVFVNALICPLFFVFFVINIFYFISGYILDFQIISFLHNNLFKIFFSIIDYFADLFPVFLSVIDIRINDFIHFINYFIISFMLCLSLRWKFRMFFILIYYLLIFLYCFSYLI